MSEHLCEFRDKFCEALGREFVLRRLVQSLLDNDPNDCVADGITVLDVWRKEARAALQMGDKQRYRSGSGGAHISLSEKALLSMNPVTIEVTTTGGAGSSSVGSGGGRGWEPEVISYTVGKSTTLDNNTKLEVNGAGQTADKNEDFGLVEKIVRSILWILPR